MKTLTYWLKFLFVLGIILFLFLGLLTSPAFAATSRVPLTLTLLEERLNAPILSDGISTLDLRNFIIDLTTENAEFQDQFYQQLQTKLNRSKQPLGLDFSNCLIQGDFIASKLGLPTPLSKASLPLLLTAAEQEQLGQDIQFLSDVGEQVTSVSVFRGSLNLHGSLFTGKADFSKTFFLQRVEASSATFTQESNWSEARFGRTVDFNQTNFGREVNFSKSTFWGQARFRQVQFQGTTKFIASIFQSEAIFDQSQFLQLADFSQIQWMKEVSFNQVNCRDRLLFSKSRFFHNLSLANSTFEKAVVFRTTRFSRLIDFQDVKLLGQVDFSNALFFPLASLNVSGLAFDSDQAKILGDTGVVGRVISLPKLEGNETIIRNLIMNFRNLEQIADANQIEYTMQQLRLQEISNRILNFPANKIPFLSWIGSLIGWLFLSALLLLSNYGTNVGLVLGGGILTITYFGFLFWFIDQFRRRTPQPIIPKRYDTIWMISSFISLSLIGLTNVFESSEQPIINLTCLGFILFPITLLLTSRLYQQGRYHDLMDVSYFVQDGSMRQLRLLIVRLPVIPEFPFFRDRYTAIIWHRRWNWLNYYDVSCNNLIKLGFNDIRIRDEHIPGIVSTLVWYQWSLGILYIVLLLWTLSRTIPGLNLLIYLK